MNRQYDTRVARRLNLRPEQVGATIGLLDDGNTIPFIARYRKEATLNLDEFQIRQIDETVKTMRQVDDRRDTIVASIDEQDKLTPDLKAQLESADTLTELEDLYQPYRPKRRTRAGTARENGLEPLADVMLQQPRRGDSPGKVAQGYLSDEVPSVDEALQGARDIVAEIVTDNPAIRGTVREKAMQYASLRSKRINGADDPKGTYKTYYEFEARVPYLKPHQVLAINRGESDEVLRVYVDIARRDWRDPIYEQYQPDMRSPWGTHLRDAIEDGAKRLLLPSIERDVRRTLTDDAEAHAINVFATNLRNLLQQPPLKQHVVMGVDPAYRTGCKIAVVDERGQVLTTDTVYPHPPQKRHDDALSTLRRLLERYHITIISIGNGTASRETEQLIAELTRERPDVQYAVVNEAGASVYSASPLARAELPDLDVSLRGAVNIARRLQDPLAELVKIDPRSIGVGLYQHDINQTALSDALDATVESVVNRVGVDVNTASSALLQYVAGIGKKLAANIVAHRNDNGAFPTRHAVMQVHGMGAKSFEQAAGFLRVNEGDNPLDSSAIHPESYEVAQALMQRAGISLDTPPEAAEQALTRLAQQVGRDTLADELGTGALTLADIMEQIARPGRDPRDDVDPPLLRSDVLSMADLKPGMSLSGTVRNVVDFGAFIDIGVKQDGLLHVSKKPRDVSLAVGDVIQVEVLSVDMDRGRIGLGYLSG
jgi:uncharacterized protein